MVEVRPEFANEYGDSDHAGGGYMSAILVASFSGSFLDNVR